MMKSREEGFAPESDRPAWERELALRNAAKPVSFDENPSDWTGIDGLFENRRNLLYYLWASEVPGSRAPEHLMMGMIQAWHNRGYDVTEAERLLNLAFDALARKDSGELERLTGRILSALRQAPRVPNHPSRAFAAPEGWEEIAEALPAAAEVRREPEAPLTEEVKLRIRSGWVGQNAGGAYGTALEGYTGEALNAAYGEALNGYVTEPETLNDDLTFEIAFLKAVGEAGDGEFSADNIADWWLKILPFGWSAEFFALENLRRGLYPPESGRFGNPFSEWIGAQMRTMVCGFCAPGRPLLAANLAYLDSSVSHTTNGIYGGIHGAVLTSLAFVESDPRRLLARSRDYLPRNSEFLFFFDKALEAARNSGDHLAAWELLKEPLKTYNWIHVYPNMAANVLSLWFGGGDLTRSFRILADCGMDVDCNAGVVGSVLGVITPVPPEWADPLGETIHTYIPGMEEISLDSLTDWTWAAVKRFCR